MIEPTVIAAAGAGLFAGAMGGAHCAAMCGGIAGAIPIRPLLGPLGPAAQQGPASGTSLFTRNLAFNAGRIASYTFAGALAGSISSAAFVMHDTMVLRQLLFAAANLMLIALGLYLAGLWHGITALERGGAVLWRRIQPLAAGLLRSPSTRHTLALGALWGWIPCGLVYSMLVTALASGSAANGALIMLAFGLGTLPNLLALGLAGAYAGKYLRNPAIRIAAGLIVASFGAVGLWRLPQLAKLDGWGAMCLPALHSVRGFFGA
jgi:sulfite exporter TauE/SafE